MILNITDINGMKYMLMVHNIKKVTKAPHLVGKQERSFITQKDGSKVIVFGSPSKVLVSIADAVLKTEERNKVI